MIFDVIKIFVLLILIDTVYLYFTKNLFGEMVVRIQRVAMQVRLWSAAIVYIFAAILLYMFIIKNRRPVWEAGLLGLATYGIFDFTNHAILKNYDLQIAVMDCIWGGILFSATTKLYYSL